MQYSPQPQRNAAYNDYGSNSAFDKNKSQPLDRSVLKEAQSMKHIDNSGMGGNQRWKN